MTIVMTLPLSDGSETLDDQLRFQLAAGVDLVLVDPGEADGAQTVLEPYLRDGRVQLVRSQGSPSDRTRALGAAARERGADWVIPAAPAEVWWPRGGSLDEILGKIPAEFDVVQALERRFLRLDGPADGPFARRIYRLQPQAALDADESQLGPARRIAHRGGVDIGEYDGGLVRSELRPLRGWYPVEVLVYPDGPVEPQEWIEAGIAKGVVVEDTRVRDALALLDGGSPIAFHRPSVVENALFAIDASVLGEADAFQLRGELDELERRLADAEENIAFRAARKLQGLARRARRSG